jgi:PadR family transcriptional regulator, regulatory protein PadR
VRLTTPTKLVLLAIGGGARYGFDVIDATGLPSGTVYPILRRLELAGFLRSRWEAARVARLEQRPPRRYYQLAGTGAALVREIGRDNPRLAAALRGPWPPAPATA